MAKISKIEPSMPTIKSKKRVCAYARVSADKERSLHSLSAQISYYNDLIQKNPEWEYVGVYSDKGISATKTTGRDEFNRLIDDCEKGLIDIVLCKSISRFARNTVDLLKIVRQLKAFGIEVRFEKENINSLSEDGEIMLSILASFAQEESISISENAKWSIRKRYEQGKSRNIFLYGYTKTDKGLVVDENQAKVVNYIFNEFLNGKSCYAIAQNLNRTNVPSYHNKKWHQGVILGMLRQEKYIGDSLLQKFFVEDCLTHKNVKNKGQLPMYYVESSHTAIIERDIFNQAQLEFSKRYNVDIKYGIAEKDKYSSRHGEKLMRPSDEPCRKAEWSTEARLERSQKYKNRETAPLLKYELSLFIQCEVCGNNLTGQVRKYADGSCGLKWVCNNHTKSFSLDSKPQHMSDTVLKNLVADVLGLDEFDNDMMCKNLNGITVNSDILTFHFVDGEKINRIYTNEKRQYRRKVVEENGESNNNSSNNT